MQFAGQWGQAISLLFLVVGVKCFADAADHTSLIPAECLLELAIAGRAVCMETEEYMPLVHQFGALRTSQFLLRLQLHLLACVWLTFNLHAEHNLKNNVFNIVSIKNMLDRLTGFIFIQLKHKDEHVFFTSKGFYKWNRIR